MKVFKIKRGAYIEWAFQDAEDSKGLLELLLTQLKETGKAEITVEDAMQFIEPECIPLSIIEGFEDDDREIYDLENVNEYKIELI